MLVKHFQVNSLVADFSSIFEVLWFCAWCICRCYWTRESAGTSFGYLNFHGSNFSTVDRENVPSNPVTVGRCQNHCMQAGSLAWSVAALFVSFFCSHGSYEAVHSLDSWGVFSSSPLVLSIFVRLSLTHCWCSIPITWRRLLIPSSPISPPPFVIIQRWYYRPINTILHACLI